MNQVTLLGRLTKDVILRTSSNNKKFTYFTVAVDTGYQQKSYYVSCIAWERLAENMAKYVGKGSQVLVSGYLSTRRDAALNQNIMEVVSNNVTFLDRKKQYVSDPQPEANDYEKKPSLPEPDLIITPPVMHSETDYESDISYVSSNNLNHIIDNDTKEVNIDEDDEAIIWD